MKRKIGSVSDLKERYAEPEPANTQSRPMMHPAVEWTCWTGPHLTASLLPVHLHVYKPEPTRSHVASTDCPALLPFIFTILRCHKVGH